jgi:hypothetical protein
MGDFRSQRWCERQPVSILFLRSVLRRLLTSSPWQDQLDRRRPDDVLRRGAQGARRRSRLTCARSPVRRRRRHVVGFRLMCGTMPFCRCFFFLLSLTNRFPFRICMCIAL